jgi:hypothetical protein
MRIIVMHVVEDDKHITMSNTDVYIDREYSRLFMIPIT